ncbi:MAG: hypothetical protein V2B19_05520 [Pseudomonadota bacterium]
MTYPDRISLKPYLDKITALCEKLPREDLLALIIAMARKVPMAERKDFISEIESNLPRVAPEPDIPADAVESLIEQITGLEESIIERIESIENGEYWDEEDRYDDEDPDNLSEDHIEELQAFFDEAGTLFLQDRLTEARRIYAALFTLIRNLSETRRLYLPGALELREARARYCRCLLEAGAGKLTDAFIAAMDIEAEAKDLENSLSGDFPLMRDIIDARPGDIGGLTQFFTDWCDFLSGRDITGNRIADLLLEAIFEREGIAGAGKLAQTWKEKQPRGYLFWIGRLLARKEWETVITESKTALGVLPEGNYREKVSEFIIEAASALKDGDAILLGKRERFFSRLRDEHLKDLLAEAIARKVKEAELETVLRFIGDRAPSDYRKSYQVRLLLMAGRLKPAFELVRKESGIGWSTGNAGVVFGAVLSTVTGHTDQAGVTQELLRYYSERSIAYSYRITTDDRKDPALFYREIVNGLKSGRPTDSEMAEMRSWAMEIGAKRIDGIVSNKRRGAYDRAARVLGCLAEALAVTGKKDESRKLLRTYYSEKYNRFSAFRTEVKAVMQKSPMLRKLGVTF